MPDHTPERLAAREAELVEYYSAEHDGAVGYTLKPIYMETRLGRRFDPLLMDSTDVAIEDIAHSLALQCRYNGHSQGFLSVARHSLWVAHEVDLAAGHNTELTLTGLLHDAAEAYLGDIIRPLKHRPMLAGYLDAEKHVERAIADHFGLPYPHPEIIKAADVTVTATREREERYKWNSYWKRDKSDFLREFDRLSRERT